MADDFEFIDIDLESIPDEGFPPIPDTNPGMIVDSAEPRKKEGAPYPYIALTLKPIPGQVDQKYENTHAYLNLSFHPNALWNMKQFLTPLGIKSIKGLRPKELCAQLVGQRIRPTLSIIENNKGKKVNEVGPPYHAFD